MPPSAKKRKISEATYETRGIAAFGKISKSQPQTISSKQDVIEDSICLETIAVSTSEKVQVKKRKLEGTAHREDEKPTSRTRRHTTDEEVVVKSSTKSKAKPKAKLSLSPSVIAPSKVRKKIACKTAAKETPTKGARAYLESLVLTSSPPSSPSPVRSSQSPCPNDTPLSSPPSITKSGIEDFDSFDLSKPVKVEDEVRDLIALYSSFLNALSLHYAHHGSLTPVDLRILKPTVERCWRRRRTCDDDLRRVIAIALTGEKDEDHGGLGQCDLCSFSLLDYGNGKICVEIAEDPRKNTVQGRPLNVDKLTRLFAQKIRKLWEQHVPSAQTTFTSSLLFAPIIPCSSLKKVSPLFSKGQRRLEDLKVGAIKAQITNKFSSIKGAQPLTLSTPAKVTSDRVTSLLDRIRAKELYQSTLPSAPSPEYVAKRSALQRLEEVIAVLEILTSSGGSSGSRSILGTSTNGSHIEIERSYSFTMPTLIQHFQMSLRNPISKDETTLCIRLLADEIVPAWIAVREVGKLLGVTVRGRMGITREEARGRIQEALKNH
ncbi:MAG: hypothetical protein MMC33_001655 [Icmadophila ericetorum]|nr:hypothetical protein [Icmadophila ericetorum]